MKLMMKAMAYIEKEEERRHYNISSDFFFLQ
jgi:hypothetical protein